MPEALATNCYCARLTQLCKQTLNNFLNVPRNFYERARRPASFLVFFVLKRHNAAFAFVMDALFESRKRLLFVCPNFKKVFPLLSVNSNLCHTVWRFQDFSITQILGEINFWESRIAKLAHFCHLNFVNLVYFSLQKVQIFIKIKIQSLWVCQNGRFCTSGIPKIDFM